MKEGRMSFLIRTTYDALYVATRGVMDIVVVNGQGDLSSNPCQGCLHFT